MGSFESFAAAQDAAPSSKPVGYDNAGAEQLYSAQLHYWDYPALFWIGRSLEQGMNSVFDLGGHVGVKYYAFKRVLGDTSVLRWKVCDVPSIARAGREIADKREMGDRLTFCTDFREASGCDVLMASGSLQYLPTRIAEILQMLPTKPKRIVLNTTAVHPVRTLFTLNSIIVAVCPYRIQHHDALLQELTESGYRRLDTWRNDGKPIQIPFVAGGDQPYYFGGCWELK